MTESRCEEDKDEDAVVDTVTIVMKRNGKQRHQKPGLQGGVEEVGKGAQEPGRDASVKGNLRVEKEVKKGAQIPDINMSARVSQGGVKKRKGATQEFNWTPMDFTQPQLPHLSNLQQFPPLGRQKRLHTGRNGS